MKTIIYTLIIYVFTIFSAQAQYLAYDKKSKYDWESRKYKNQRRDDATFKKIDKKADKNSKKRQREIEAKKENYGTKKSRENFNTSEMDKQQRILNYRANRTVTANRKNNKTQAKKLSASDKSKIYIKG